MIVKTDADGYVTGFATLGGMEGGQEYTGVVPEDLAEKIGFYLLRAGLLTLDTAKKAAAEKSEADAARIAELKVLLAESDYKAIKYAEGFFTEAEYAPIKAQRQGWRDEINGLEEK